MATFLFKSPCFRTLCFEGVNLYFVPIGCSLSGKDYIKTKTLMCLQKIIWKFLIGFEDGEMEEMVSSFFV